MRFGWHWTPGVLPADLGRDEEKNNMKTKQPHPEKNVAEDLKTFEQLSVETKELLVLSDQVEKSSGPGKLTLQKLAQVKSKAKIHKADQPGNS